MPSLLADQFGSLTKSFGYTLAIAVAQLPGYFLAAWLVEIWGRRKTLSVFLAVSAVAAFAFSQAGSVAAVLGFGMLLSASNLGAWGVLYAVTPEIYPTRLRAAASGAAAACGRVAAIIAPLLMPWFLTLSGGNRRWHSSFSRSPSFWPALRRCACRNALVRNLRINELF